MSEQKKKPNPEEVARAKKLAADILGQLEGVLTVKLRELKPQLEELRQCFKTLSKGDRIEGCRTWEQFCSDKLHRTDRAVRQLLANSKSEDREVRAEESSAASDEAKSTCDASHEAASNLVADDDEPEAVVEDWENAKSEAKKKVRKFFNNLDSVSAIEEKMNDLLEGLIPCRKFKVTVVEVIVEEA